MMDKNSERPYTQGATVTPSDTVDIPGGKCRALHISVAGTLRVTMGGATVNFPVMPVGIHRLSVSRVHATGTAATGIVALN
jgi:hypothetical protein